MSRFRKSFNDRYSQLWELLDKPKMKYRDRNRAKHLLNQLWKEYYLGKYYKKPLKFSKKDIKDSKE